MHKSIKKEHEEIWKVVNNISSGMIVEGKPIHWGKISEILSYEEIFKKAMTNLKEIGFSVQRVDPKKANGILRVFSDKNLEYDNETYWMYGSQIYLKTTNGMMSYYEDLIDYSRFRVQNWFFQDESTIFEPNFVDYYLKIKKQNKKDMD